MKQTKEQKWDSTKYLLRTELERYIEETEEQGLEDGVDYGSPSKTAADFVLYLNGGEVKDPLANIEFGLSKRTLAEAVSMMPDTWASAVITRREHGFVYASAHGILFIHDLGETGWASDNPSIYEELGKKVSTIYYRRSN